MLLMGGPQYQIPSFLQVKVFFPEAWLVEISSTLLFHPDTSGSHLHNHAQSSISVLSVVQNVPRVKQLLIKQPDANVMNQHNKYSDK